MRLVNEVSSRGPDSLVTRTATARDHLFGCGMGRTTSKGGPQPDQLEAAVSELIWTVFLYNSGRAPAEDIRVELRGLGLGLSATLRSSPNVSADLGPDLADLDGVLRVVSVDALPEQSLAYLEIRSTLATAYPGRALDEPRRPSSVPRVRTGDGSIGVLDPVTADEAMMTLTRMTGGSLEHHRYSPKPGASISIFVLERGDTFPLPDPIPQEGWWRPTPSEGGCEIPHPDSIWAVEVGAMQAVSDSVSP